MEVEVHSNTNTNNIYVPVWLHCLSDKQKNQEELISLNSSFS